MTSNAMSLLSPHAGLGLAFVLGLLIGVERGWAHRNDPEGSRVAGIRTFALLGLAGGLAGEATGGLSPLFGGAIFILTALALLIGYGRASKAGDVSATTTVVGIITLGLGAFAAAGQPLLACIVAGATILILAERRQLHGWLARVSELEMQAIARFALIALAILPLLPDRNLGPLSAWNPRQIWLVVVFVSSLSLLGYAAGKLLGPTRGILATAAAGAVVSSTAVTAALADHISEKRADETLLVGGIALASTIMFARVILLVGVLAPFALAPFLLVAGPGVLVSAICALWAMRRPPGQIQEANLGLVRNPFDLGPALILAGVVMAVSLAARWALRAFDGAGLVTVLGISGLVDVDAAIISMSRLPVGSLKPMWAGLILAAPVLANTTVKAGIVLAIARGGAGWRGAVSLLLSLLAGLVGVGAIWVLYR